MAVVTAVSGRVAEIGSSAASTATHERAAGSGYLKPPLIVSTVSGIMARHQAEAQATAIPQPDFSGQASAAATPESLGPPSFTYTIQEGDTIDSIAATFGLDPAYIIWNNQEINANPDLLLVGETLIIPAMDGIVYHVTLGDTLSDIAAVYQIDVESIVGFTSNGIASADDVTEGMVLLLPGAVPPPAPEPVYVAVEEEPASGGSGGAAALAVAPPPAVDSAPSSVAGFIWPYYGPISTYFGEYGHRGIDIDGFGNYGAPIYAAAEGLVVLASWSDYGYGYHVIIDHGDGTQTLYAHLSEIWVSQGQYVGQGEAIGSLGSTGYSTGPHLHFEVLVGGVNVDPLAYLP